MPEIQDIAIGSIDPKSTVNVRRSQVEEGVEKVKCSIAQHGFWRNNPITVRPHPDRSSEYEYEIVVGQCRLNACLQLGKEEIPAVVEEIDDDAAIRRSWAENESRSDLTRSDKAYWVHRMVARYFKEGKNKTESRELAAKFLGVSVPTIVNYDPLVVLPESVANMMDDGSLRLEDAKAIAKYSNDPSNAESSEQKMKERAEWIAKLDKPHKDKAVKALEELGPAASIDELHTTVEEKLSTEAARIEVAIPEDLRPRLLEWGRERGLTDEATIITHMIAETLRRK